MANTYFHRTMDRTTDSGYTKKWIFSAWIKISQLGGVANKGLFSIQKGSTSNSRVNVGFDSGDKLWVETKDSTGNDDAFKATDMLFRDTNSFYHIYIKYDSTESTASDRLVIYVNGVAQTYNNVNEVSSGFGILMSSAVDWRLGIYRTNGGTNRYFDGIMSYVHFSEFNDGDTPTPYTAFGSTDATTGEWKINTSPTVSYGSQGLFVLKDNNLGTDQSGQSNNITASGTCTKTEDCPDNVFATANPLIANGNIEYSNGNLNTYHTYSGQWRWTASTLGASTGKYYSEYKISAIGSEVAIGIMDLGQSTGVTPSQNSANDFVGKFTNSISYTSGGSLYKDNSVSQSSVGTYTTNDIIGVAMDLDNNTVQFYKNGSTIGSTVSITSGLTYNIGVSGYGDARILWNTGNGYFGTTAVSSAGTNASGIGIFEYDVPANFTALSTKGLNL